MINDKLIQKFKGKSTGFSNKSKHMREVNMHKTLNEYKSELQQISNDNNVNIHTVNLNFLKLIKNDFKHSNPEEMAILHLKHHGVNNDR